MITTKSFKLSDGRTFYHGQAISCTIDGHKCTDAKISINPGGNIYICQNVINGASAADKLRYAYSWYVGYSPLKRLPNNIQINKTVTVDDYEIF